MSDIKNQKNTSYDWAHKNITETLEELSVSESKGLSLIEVRTRRKKFGFNQIRNDQTNLLKDFMMHFWGPIPWMLETALILSIIANRTEDFILILSMLLINGTVSYWQEFKTENASKTMKKKFSGQGPCHQKE